VPPTQAVLDSASEALAAHLADIDDDIAPVFAEAAVSQVLVTIEAALAGADEATTDESRHFWTEAARILSARSDLESGVLLSGLSRLAGRPGRLALQRAWLTRKRVADPLPSWVDRVADFQLTAAIVSTDVTGDGRCVVLDYADDDHPHTIVVFIDNNLGGMAKDVFVGPELKVVRETYAESGGVEISTVPPEVALGLILRGMAMTMETDEPPVAESFDFFAGLLMARIQQLDIVPVFPADEPELGDRERGTLVHEFAASAYAARIEAARADLERIARLWIDHAVDYTVGGPLRVSPILVELFLADFVPRKVAADRDLLDLLPKVVTAWLRFAGARTGIDAATVREALRAVDRWTPAMRARSGDPSAWGITPSGGP
jgi:hypothetical protein